PINYFDRSSTFNRHLPDCARCAGFEVLIDHPFAVTRKDRPIAFGITKGQLLGVRSVSINSPDLKGSCSIRVNGNVTSIRRNGWGIVSLGLGGKLPRPGAIASEFINVGMATRV